MILVKQLKSFRRTVDVMKVFFQFQVFVCVLVCVAYASAGFLGGGGGGGGGWQGNYLKPTM